MNNTLKDKLKKVEFIVFSDDWGRHPSSCQHLFGQIKETCKIHWINTIGLRTPQITKYDIKRAFQIIKNWIGPKPKERKKSTSFANPSIYSPFMLPFYQWDWVFRLNSYLLQKTVDKIINQINSQKNVYLVSTLPIIPSLFKHSKLSGKIYYCVDDFTRWPGVDGKTMQNLEQKLLSYNPDIVTVSDVLHNSRSKHGKRSIMITHGVDIEHFAETRAKVANQKTTSKKTIGMFGVIDDRWDFDLIETLTMKFPNWEFLVLGPIDRDITTFQKHPNIQFKGSIPYENLPRECSIMNALILPYNINEITESINPLKLKEYLATSLPVVSTPLKESIKLKNYITVASAQDFPAALEKSIHKKNSEEAMQFLKHESWKTKAHDFFNFILA